jgi:hypothetical protein
MSTTWDTIEIDIFDYTDADGVEHMLNVEATYEIDRYVGRGGSDDRGNYEWLDSTGIDNVRIIKCIEIDEEGNESAFVVTPHLTEAVGDYIRGRHE